MVKINYCPSCGHELSEESAFCPNCNLDLNDLFDGENHVEIIEADALNPSEIDVASGDEIVIVVPEEAVENGELEIDLDELGIDVESLGDDVNIVVQIEGEGEFEADDGLFDDDDIQDEPNEWYFDDDPYDIVYYEFPEDDFEE